MITGHCIEKDGFFLSLGIEAFGGEMLATDE